MVLPLLIMVLFTGVSVAQSVPSNVQPGTTTAPSQGNAPAQHHQTGKHGKSAAPVQVAPPPSPPPTPEQMAPLAPKVSYSGGQLTIQSQNATLAQVLRAVGSKTGAAIDIPSGASSDRVVAQLGPGQPSDVLSSLLNGSRFNYIILGVANQPGSVQRVVLTLRQSGPPATTSVAQNQPAQQPQQPQDDDYSPPEPTPADDNSAENQPTPPGVYHGPGSYIPPQNAEFPAPQPSADGNLQAPQGAKTPEQLLQELQKIQQQQQQYQQQLNPANQNIPQPYQQPPQ